METQKQIQGLDNEGNTVNVLLKYPGQQEYRDSQIEYNKAFRRALDSGALLRQKLSDYAVDQDIWNDEKQEKNDKFVEEISAKEEMLRLGGIPLSEAKQIALELRTLRFEFREFLAERNQLDQNSVEGQADNARFSELVRLCMLNPNTKKPYFQSQADYDASVDQPWVVEASSELAQMIYGLDPDYDNKLAENKFLKEFDFVDEDLRLVNNDGHLVDVDGRLVDEDGRFVAYRTEKAQKEQDAEARYFVNKDGEEVVEVVDEDGDVSWHTKDKVERKPFLDENGKPIVSAKKEEALSEEDLVAEKPKAKPKRTTKKKPAEG